ncbi:hypothetical protein NIA69_03755 [Gemmiger formicilis]|nr:hypothetical protein [Gemmiger formicilis]
MLTLGQLLFGILSTSLCSIAAYFLLVRKMTDKHQYDISTRQSLTSTLIVILIVEVFSVAASTAYENGMESLYLVCNLYDAFCCLFFCGIRPAGCTVPNWKDSWHFNRRWRSSAQNSLRLRGRILTSSTANAMT